MPSTNKLESRKNRQISTGITQGDCVNLRNNEELFQVVGIDNKLEKCWVRRWPLLPHGSPVFEISIQQVTPKTHIT